MKNFFENPELLTAWPVLVLGLVGLAVASMTLLAPATAGGGAKAPEVRHGTHPSPELYVQIGLILAAVTAIEVIVYYFDIQRAVFILILLGLSAVKFALVTMFFMHLKFDSRLFSIAFIAGFALAASLFVVVLATLGGNLV